MTVPHIYRKIASRLSKQYGRWNNQLEATREEIRKAIPLVRITREDVPIVMRELERMKKLKRVNQRKMRLI